MTRETPLPRRRPSAAEGLFGTDRPGELHLAIYRSLLHAIASGRFAAGSKLPSEPQLARAFSVSRPVARQAVEKLKAAGFVVAQPGSGTYVTSDMEQAAAQLSNPATLRADIAQMQRDLEFRAAYEPEAARLAALRGTEEDHLRLRHALDEFQAAQDAGCLSHHHDFRFHHAIAQAAGNAHFVQTSERLEYAQDPAWLVLRPIIYFQNSPDAAEVLAEHATVAGHILNRAAEPAARAMAQHIASSQARLARYLMLAQWGKDHRALTLAQPEQG